MREDASWSPQAPGSAKYWLRWPMCRRSPVKRSVGCGWRRIHLLGERHDSAACCVALPHSLSNSINLSLRTFQPRDDQQCSETESTNNRGVLLALDRLNHVWWKSL